MKPSASLPCFSLTPRSPFAACCIALSQLASCSIPSSPLIKGVIILSLCSIKSYAKRPLTQRFPSLVVVPGAGDVTLTTLPLPLLALESIFKSVPFREFTFPFTFAPKNEKEKDSVHKILQLFRFHMLPQHKNDANGYFDVPSEFQITYMYRDNENAYLPKVSRCVLKNCEINYAPDNVVSTLTPDERGAPPTITTMNLTFGETEIMTKETVAKGY